MQMRVATVLPATTLGLAVLAFAAGSAGAADASVTLAKAASRFRTAEARVTQVVAQEVAARRFAPVYVPAPERSQR